MFQKTRHATLGVRIGATKSHQKRCKSIFIEQEPKLKEVR